ncbi:MAG: 2-hydroxychromene-2-carboxylate isomerase [Polyangiaceae bacterium]|nr:2-hydroxychromene-2-carboxylate isomerase [Polyangiaceae bacterium]
MKHVDFYFDLSCPYAYLAHHRVNEAITKHGATVTWKPFLLGGVFRAIGTPDQPGVHMPMNKARHNLLDMHRWAEWWGVPFKMPPTHPNRTVLALRAILASRDIERAATALYTTYWAEGLDVSKPEVVKESLDRAGFDGAALLEKAETPEIKEALRKATDEAIAAGVFGAPAFVATMRDEPGVSDATELYWGQDRLALVEEMLSGKTLPNAVKPAEKDSVYTLEFFFDFSSPFAYLASERVEEVAKRARAKLVWRPFLLGGLFQAVGTPNVPLFEMPAPKRKHSGDDMFRWAARFGARIKFPSRFPMNTVKPLRMTLALAEGDRAPFIHAVMRAYWSEDRDISDNGVLAEIASLLGHDGQALVMRTQDEALKTALRDATQEASTRGAFGAPTFFVGDLLFWGQDRLDFVERALGGWRPACG